MAASLFTCHKTYECLCPGKGTMLEVILQNSRGQRGTQGFPSGLDCTHDLAAADDFCSRKPGDFSRQNEIDFQLSVRLQHFIGLEQHSRTADVFGCALMPIVLAETAVTQWQAQLESLGT